MDPPTRVCLVLPHHDHAMACRNQSVEEQDRDRGFDRGGFYAVAVALPVQGECHVSTTVPASGGVRWAKAEATTVEALVQVDLRAVWRGAWWHNEDHYSNSPKGYVYKLVRSLQRRHRYVLDVLCFIPHSGRAKIRHFICKVSDFELEVVEHFLASLWSFILLREKANGYIAH